ncbi:25S rRNA (uracil2843-N3)-methyltransferase, partial [Phenoliferia sp. Uapishka_3]
MTRPLKGSVHQTFSYGTPQHINKHGSGRAKKPSAATSTTAAPAGLSKSERSLLSLLATLYASTLSDLKWPAHVQDLKAALYNKDVEKAFGGEDDLFRRVYAARWAAGHALVYRKIFVDMGLREMLKEGGDIVVLGGGSGAEVLALGSLLSTPSSTTLPVRITTYDILDWSSILKSQIAALSAAHATLNLTLDAHTHDILSLPLPSFPATTALITLILTAAECFSQSRPATVAMLAHLSSTCPEGTQLLVVESASLALVPVGEKTYPMETLVDHALGKSWEVVKKEENQWYRLEDHSDCYQIKLENSKLFLRLYEKVL